MSFMNCSKLILSISRSSFILTVFLPVLLHGFNIDTKNVRLISGDKGTLFGFTAQFMPLNKDTNMVGMLIAAPAADTGPNADGDGPKTGALKVCYDITNEADGCTETLYRDDQMSMENGTFDERFGSGLSITESGKFMVCSPRWKDTSLINGYNYKFMPGRCTIHKMDSTDRPEELLPFFHTGNDRDKYVPHTLKEYYHGLASYGFSVDSDQKSIFVSSAPGVMMSEGKVLIRDDNTREFSETITTLENKLNTTAYSYLGYSVKIGKFCDGTDICIAAGAPGQNRVGMVHMYKWINQRRSLSMTKIIPGSQAWSYYGSSLGAADVNNNGYDELLVGAPYHTDDRDELEGHDQGRVFVYSRTASSQDLQHMVTLEGTRKKFARFGTALQNIGDINLDGYQDIAVGAPGEEDGAGAVYVYLGGPTGLVNLPSQRITASQISSSVGTPIKGLGFAFSNYATLPGQSYPTFAATSVESDAVVLLKCRPIVDLTRNFTANPNPVDAEQSCDDVKKPCFNITLCMSFNLLGESKRPLNFQIGLDIDIQRSSTLKRALFLKDGDVVDTIPMSKERILANGKCLNFRAILRENQVNQDRFTPVEIVARYTLDEEDKPPGIDPVLDAAKPNNVSLTVTFVNKCGDDNKCEVDLSVEADLDYRQTGQWNSIVVNDTKEIMVKFNIKNSGETSYWTVLTVEVDSPIPFSRFKSDFPVICQALEFKADDPGDKTASLAAAPVNMDKSIVKCNYYKPLDQDATLSLLVAFDTENMILTKNKLTIKTEVQPKNKISNPELRDEDNHATLTSDIQIIAMVSIDSSSSPSEVTIEEAKQISLAGPGSDVFRTDDKEVKPMNLTHKILVRNNGPSFLPNTTINVMVPMFIRDGSKLVHRADVKIGTADGRVTQCEPSHRFDSQVSPDSSTTTPSTTKSTTGVDSSTSGGSSGETGGVTSSTPTTTFGFNPDGPINRRRRAADDEAGKVQDTIYSPACEPDSNFCEIFVCTLDTIIPTGGHAEINVSMVIEETNIPVPQDFNTFYFLTRVEVIEPEHPLFKRWEKPTVRQTVTKFHLVQSGGRINIWIIIGSVIGGLVLITIIVIVLWKLGFFKRQKHHEVAQWKRESQRRSKKGYSKAPQEDAGTSGSAVAAAGATSDNDL